MWNFGGRNCCFCSVCCMIDCNLPCLRFLGLAGKQGCLWVSCCGSVFCAICFNLPCLRVSDFGWMVASKAVRCWKNAAAQYAICFNLPCLRFRTLAGCRQAKLSWCIGTVKSFAGRMIAHIIFVSMGTSFHIVSPVKYQASSFDVLEFESWYWDEWFTCVCGLFLCVDVFKCDYLGCFIVVFCAYLIFGGSIRKSCKEANDY